jgi:DNA-binding response OmpR family regulator
LCYKSNKKYDTYNNFGDYLVINDKIKSDIKNNEPIFSLLTGSAYTIFKKLYTHKNNVIPIKELQNSISKTKEPKPTTVYCIISNIRKLIKNHGNNYNIIKIGDGYKLQ